MKWALIFAIGFLIVFPARALYVAPGLDQSEVVKRLAGDGSFPTTLDGLRQKLESTGSLSDVFVPFSEAPAATDLDEARIVASNSAKLFVGLIPRNSGEVDFEFISWNSETRTSDFGVVRNFGDEKRTRIEKVDSAQCTICHVNRATIFTKRPWLTAAGANDPLATHTSVAMLVKMALRNPDEFSTLADWALSQKLLVDPHFGTLTDAAKVKLGNIRKQGFKLFQFFNGRKFDDNVRQLHLLQLTHDLLRAGTADEGKSLIRALTLGALGQWLNPDRLKFSFGWDKVLRTRAKHPEGSETPLLKNYHPAYDNSDVVSALEEQKTQRSNPVDWILGFDNYRKRSKATGFPRDVLPSAGKAAFEPFEAEGNGASAIALNLLTELTEADLKRLRLGYVKYAKNWDELVKNRWVTALFTENRFPERKAILAAFENAFEGVDYGAGRVLPVDATPTSARCLTCHDGSGSAKKFYWDPMNYDQWTKALRGKAPLKPDEARKWAKLLLSRMKDGTMPPPKSTEARGFNPDTEEWKELRRFLEDF